MFRWWSMSWCPCLWPLPARPPARQQSSRPRPSQQLESEFEAVGCLQMQRLFCVFLAF